jgi:tetratricopeptide (TPR) repeat protein
MLALFPLASFAQQEKKSIVEGNKKYDAKKYDQAEKSYRNALQLNKDSYKAAFNLGDAYYKQGKFDEAAEQFQMLTHRATSKDTLAKAYHNLGNSLLQSKKYQESVNAYKNALKNDPSDEDTRYNLSYALQKLKQQQQQQKDKQDKEDKQDKKDQNKDKDKDKNKDQKENKDQNKDQQKDKQKKDQKDKEQPQISKEDAQRLLEALQNDEKNLQDKVKKGKVKGVKVQIEKDW